MHLAKSGEEGRPGKPGAAVGGGAGAAGAHQRRMPCTLYDVDMCK